MDDQGKWEVRIQALLAKAESTNSEEERASILEKVDDLMAKWGIDRAMIEARRIADGAPPRLGHLTLEFEGMAGQTRQSRHSFIKGGGRRWPIINSFPFAARANTI